LTDDLLLPDSWIELLVTVKAYPTPSQKYSESVCVAGLRTDTIEPEWVRLYPVRFRDLPRGKQFHKYDVIRVRARRRTGDGRSESFSPDVETLTVIDHFGCEDGWARRIPVIEAVRLASMCELARRQARDGTSLGVFRPAEIVRFEATPTSAEWDQARAAALGQGSLLCQRTSRRPLEKIPYDFHFTYRCDDPGCSTHRMSLIDWELGEHYRKTAGRPEDERLRLVEERWMGRVCGASRDTHFFAGSLAKRPKQFVLLGAFWPPMPRAPQDPMPALF
jgi:hypothetical protein